MVMIGLHKALQNCSNVKKANEPVDQAGLKWRRFAIDGFRTAPSPAMCAAALSSHGSLKVPVSQSPLKNPEFRKYWFAGLSDNFGWQVQLIAASWLMTSLGGGPELVALVQTAFALPIMILSLPGGALSDLVGQRRVVIWAQTLLVLTAAR